MAGSHPVAPNRGADRRLLALAVAAVVVALDQLSKSWALQHTVVPRHVVGPLYLTLTFNRGAAFGLGAGAAPVVESVAVLLVVMLLTFGRRVGRSAGWPIIVGIGLLMGGAVGNLSDRVLRSEHGAVVDFIQAARVGTRDYWPVFNVADASIVVGVIVLALAFSARRNR